MHPIIVASDNPEKLKELVAVFSSVPGCEIVAQVKSSREMMLLLGTTKATGVVIHMGIEGGSALSLIDMIKQQRQHMHVMVALDGTEQADVWQQIVMSGLRTILTPPYAPDKAAQLLSQWVVPSQNAAHGAEKKSFLVSVTSPRSGLGKTLVSVNMAAALAQWNKKVGLIDFTGQSGDFSMMLDDVPKNSILDLIKAGEFDVDLVETVMATHSKIHGLRYLSSPGNEFNIGDLTKPMALEMIKGLRQVCDYIVVDMADWSKPATEPTIKESDIVFVVTTRDIIRISATQKYLAKLKDADVDMSKVKVLVNCAEVGVEISESEIESILEHPVTAYLPLDIEPATYSVNAGKPLVIHDPKLPLSDIIIRIAKLVFNQWQDTSKAVVQAPPKLGKK